MLKRPAKLVRRGLAFALSLVVSLGILIGIPAATLLTTPQEAEATVEAGDVVFMQSSPGAQISNNLVLRKANGAVQVLDTEAQGSLYPDASPDGSQIVYAWAQDTGGSRRIRLINSDGSGKTDLTHPDVTSDNPYLHFGDDSPRWSRDGSKIAFTRSIYYTNPYELHLMHMDRDGSNLTDLGSTTMLAYQQPSWSPDGSKLAITRMSSSFQQQIWAINADGSNLHLIDPTAYGCDNISPDWSPDGSRIYYGQSCYGFHSINYFTSTDNFATAANTTSYILVENTRNSEVRISYDGSTAYYDDTSRIWAANTSTGAVTLIADDTSNGSNNTGPAPIKATYPPVPPTNTTATFSAPSPSDPYGTRQVTVNLPAAGNQRFEFGWSNSSTTAPNTAYLQTITNMTTKKGPINFLGVYSGSGTTWNGGTQPDQNWYLWVRSVQTGGTPNAWSTPLLVHTPKPGAWVGVGDSTSSGHHLDVDQPTCAIPLSCDPTDYAANDPSFSWVTGAASNFNTTMHLPAAWQIAPVMIARSGAKTSEFGAAGETPGSIAWASQGQAGQLSVELYARYTSWNVVSVTGGANDKAPGQSNFEDALTQWYIDHIGDSYGPWEVPTGGVGPVNCPSTEDIWDNLHTNNLADTITTNLQGVVTVATNASPGVRVVDLNYPYPVNTGTQTTGNPCYSDWVLNGNTYHGVKSVVDVLHNSHAAVTGSNVKHVDLRSTFGASATVSNGYIQLTRLYGYPHWSSTGQAQAATAAAALATGSGW